MAMTHTLAYRLYREDGSIYDEATPEEPLVFSEEEETLIDGFMEALADLKVGEKTRLTIPPERGYGPYRKDLVYHVDKSTLPPELGVGDTVIGFLDGEEAELTITAIEGARATLDANHPLAGETLVLELEVLARG